jgi:Mg-chelatase subunit ChlD
MATATKHSRLLVPLIGVVLSLGCGARTDYTCVIFVVDVSDSIPFESRVSCFDRVNQLVESFRAKHDRAGVVVFGREPHFEIPIGAENIRLERRVVADVDGSASNLEAAIKLAVNSFPACDR